ncbi:MAG TPA: RNA polymerase sigma-70 factor [Bacteroidales bacterium]|nr:RNA polymerase sigma-70 factor [Bacteroidales bacterium]HOK73512.1 RNA polymerase sigma-70 factor [Bacteroidales bacterium]HOM39830.1 RNA polymerase sigma-70 factor [Bacteroidales bacterium]HPP91386.1 RNA polymerase sigma-70 factor [Bacteroidales bacterium]HRU57187.1 RNA polymerase sigma-70 factor [Bacteroidales bacterium]
MIKFRDIENEEFLVRSLSKGNILAFNTLFKEYSGRLFRFANGYLRSEAEAEEIVQEVFTIIWEKRKDLKDELSFKSYLFTIAFNIIKKYFRRKTYLAEYLNSQIYSDLDISTTDKIDYDSVCDFIRKLVDRLPDRRREIFIKSRFEGLSIKELSEELGISHKTVENQITAALKFLKENLKHEFLPAVLFFFLFIA